MFFLPVLVPKEILFCQDILKVAVSQGPVHMKGHSGVRANGDR